MTTYNDALSKFEKLHRKERKNPKWSPEYLAAENDLARVTAHINHKIGYKGNPHDTHHVHELNHSLAHRKENRFTAGHIAGLGFAGASLAHVLKASHKATAAVGGATAGAAGMYQVAKDIHRKRQQKHTKNMLEGFNRERNSDI
jgi:hypothetical protein